MRTPLGPNLSATIFPELTSETSLRSERGASRLAGSISTLVRDLNSVLAIIIGIVG
jgi:hypothetical protein